VWRTAQAGDTAKMAILDALDDVWCSGWMPSIHANLIMSLPLKDCRQQLQMLAIPHCAIPHGQWQPGIVLTMLFHLTATLQLLQ
jgi:hypothetical protein